MNVLQEHEILEMTMLQWLGSKRFLGSLTFTGDTMLRLCHELPRYSPDMDFWFSQEKDFDQFHDRLHTALSKDYTISRAHNDHLSILVEIQGKKGLSKLKIEIYKAVPPPGSSEEKIAFSPHSPAQVLVRGFTLRQMLENKVHALIENGGLRDAFDLEFLIRKGVDLDLPEEEKRKIVKRLRAFKKMDFNVALGGLLLPELRDYYEQRGFAYLEEKLSFEPWRNEGYGRSIYRK